jgi:hypothetical protein
MKTYLVHIILIHEGKGTHDHTSLFYRTNIMKVQDIEFLEDEYSNADHKAHVVSFTEINE